MRTVKLAALAVPLLLAAAAVAIQRVAGTLAAVSLVALVTIVLLVALLVVQRRRLRRAQRQAWIERQALDAVPHAVFVVDAERPGGPNVYVNAAYATLTGYGALEAVSDGFDASAIFADDTGVAAMAGDVDRGSVRVVARRRDGTTFPAEIEWCTVPHAEGGRYVVATIEATAGRGVTDRDARAGTGPPSSSVDGGGRPAGAFLSWLSHELRSPLNACLMWLDVLALGPQPDKLPKAIEAIKRGLARQAKLVGDLSDAAKVASGGLEMHHEPVDLVALIASGVGAWQRLAIRQQLEFRQRVDLAAASVDGDAERLLLALNHIVENSIHSTPPHGRVELRVYGAGAACVVEVEDTGPALTGEDVANFFVPLERSPTSARARSGLGLGLAVAHHVAARHGGSLTASTESSSTRFVLRLPLGAGPPDSAAGGPASLGGASPRGSRDSDAGR